MRILVSVLVFFLPTVLAVADDKPTFAPNQEWSYHARPQDADSTIVIGLIQDHPKMGRVIHVTVRRVNVRTAQLTLTEIGHLPISEAALAASVIELKGVVDAPQSVALGIKEWERAKGGVFTISIAQAVDYMERTLSGTPQNTER
jgi:hypothetical protein